MTDLGADLRDGRRIARAEFVRSLREYFHDRRRTAGIAVALLFFGGYLLAALPAAYRLGRTGSTAAGLPYLDTVATYLPVLLVGIAALRTVERIGHVEAEDLVLTVTHPRPVVIGLLLSEIGRLLLWFGLPLAAIATAVAVGMGSPILLVSLAALFVPLVACAAVWGYAAGIAGLRVLRHLPRIRRLLKVGSILVFIGLIVASQFLGRTLVDGASGVVERVTTFSLAPMGAYAELAFLGTPLARPVDPEGLGVIAALLAVTPIGLALATRQANAYWFTDAPVTRTASRSIAGDGDHSGFTAPWPFTAIRAGGIAWSILVRTRRRPQQLSHLLMLVFFVGPLFGGLVRGARGGLAVVGAAAGVVLGVYLSGAAFGLNPLGDDRSAFPLLLLVRPDPASYVDGRVIAGLALGLPLAVLVPLATIAVGVPPSGAVALAVAGALMCLAAAGYAQGLGCLYPIEEERELWGVETVAPSTLVLIAYSVVVLGGTGIGLLVAWTTGVGGLPLEPLVFLGLLLYLMLTIVGSLGSYLYARRRYREYALD